MFFLILIKEIKVEEAQYQLRLICAGIQNSRQKEIEKQKKAREQKKNTSMNLTRFLMIGDSCTICHQNNLHSNTVLSVLQMQARSIRSRVSHASPRNVEPQKRQPRLTHYSNLCCQKLRSEDTPSAQSSASAVP